VVYEKLCVTATVRRCVQVNYCCRRFFSGEGPRSGRYGRTAAVRLIVQPYDEDEDNDYFLSFS
jgi:hypothetical protein